MVSATVVHKPYVIQGSRSVISVQGIPQVSGKPRSCRRQLLTYSKFLFLCYTLFCVLAMLTLLLSIFSVCQKQVGESRGRAVQAEWTFAPVSVAMQVRRWASCGTCRLSNRSLETKLSSWLLNFLNRKQLWKALSK